MSGIGWLAAGLRHKIWKDEQMTATTRVEDLLHYGPAPELPAKVTLRFIDSDGNHLRYQSTFTDVGGYVIVEDECQAIIKKILAIPHMGQYIRTEIEKILEES